MSLVVRVVADYPRVLTPTEPVQVDRTAGGTIRGIGEEHQLELTLDGKRVGLFAVGGKDVYKAATGAENAGLGVSRAFTADEPMFARLSIPAGRHTIVAAFVGKPPVLSEQPQIRCASTWRTGSLEPCARTWATTSATSCSFSVSVRR